MSDSRRQGEGGSWNADAYLRCANCRATSSLGARWSGCSSCGGPLVVAYHPKSRSRLPLDPDLVLDLGQGQTPLLRGDELGQQLWLKIEGQNPTGSHKDRFHAVSIAVARDLGYEAVVVSSTGNHGAACAAYAAHADLRCLVCLHPESPPALRTQIAHYGAQVAIVPGAVKRVIKTLVDLGWYPSTGADPDLVGAGNPYGQEGYKAIAWEITDQLGRVPKVVALPGASGDTFFGVWSGFRGQASDPDALPTILVCQPEGAAPLVLTAMQGQGVPQTVADPRSLALSARDARSGWHASRVLQESGKAVAVPEQELLDALDRLGRVGLSVEPASALALAGLERARRTGVVPPDDLAVAVLTSSGASWTRDLDVAHGGPPAVFTSADDLLGSLHAA